MEARELATQAAAMSTQAALSAGNSLPHSKGLLYNIASSKRALVMDKVQSAQLASWEGITTALGDAKREEQVRVERDGEAVMGITRELEWEGNIMDLLKDSRPTPRCATLTQGEPGSRGSQQSLLNFAAGSSPQRE